MGQGRKFKYSSRQRINITLARRIVEKWGEKGDSFEQTISYMNKVMEKIEKMLNENLTAKQIIEQMESEENKNQNDGD